VNELFWISSVIRLDDHDFEAEIMEHLTQEITNEIDKEILIRVRPRHVMISVTRRL
jgi:hypothetical protein